MIKSGSVVPPRLAFYFFGIYSAGVPTESAVASVSPLLLSEISSQPDMLTWVAVEENVVWYWVLGLCIASIAVRTYLLDIL